MVGRPIKWVRKLKISQKSKKRNKNNDDLETKSGLFGLFRCASKSDKLLMLIGLLFSIIHGSSLPVLALVFGRMTNAFVIQATQGNYSASPSSYIPNSTESASSNSYSPLLSASRYGHRENSIFNLDIFNDFATYANDDYDGFLSTQAGILATTTSTIPANLNLTSIAVDNTLPQTPEEFTAYMGKFAIYYLCIGFGVLITSFLQTLCWELAAERQVQRLHALFFGQVLRQDISWYDLRTKEKGDLTTKLADDLERIREGIGSKFSMVTQYLSTFFSGIIVGIFANWRLTSAILCIGPVLIGTSAYLAKTASSAAAREQLKYSFAGGVAEEVLHSIRTVVAFGGEKIESKRYSIALEEGRRECMKQYYKMGVGVAVVYFIMYGSFGVAFWYGAGLIGIGEATPGSVFTVFFSVMAGAFSVGNALPFVSAVTTAVGAASTIFGIIDRVPDIDPYSKDGYVPYFNSQIPSNAVQGHIQFKGVYFYYPARPDVQVLKGLNLVIKPGKTVALVGTSGAGKSTIVSLLLRFYNPALGEIILDGIPLKDYNISWLRNQIGVVSQEPVLFGVSIEENIKFGYTSNFEDGDTGITTADIIKAATLANAHKFISALPNGYATLVGDRGSQLSGGQKQRIAIARAIVRDPKILLLDEATSALDAHSEGIVQDALERAMKGRTTVIIAHRLSTIRNADIIYTLKDGTVGEVGTHDELMAAHGLYYNLVTTQTQKTADDSDSEVFHDDIDSLPTEKTGNEIINARRKVSKSRKFSSSSKTTGDIEYYNFNNIDDPGTEYELSDSDKIPVDDDKSNLMWRLIKMNAPEWVWLLFGILGSTLSGVKMPVFAFFYGEIFSTFTLVGEQLKRAALFWTLMFFVLATVAGISFLIQIICMTMACEKLVARIRLMVFENILRQPIEWFDSETNSVGRLITRLARDAPMIKHAAGLRAGHLVSAGVTLLVAITIAFIYGWKLACLLLVGVPLIACASYQQTMIIRRNQLRDLKLMDSAGRVATECVSNIRTVQALNKEKLFLKIYKEYLVLPFREAKKQAFVYAAVFSFSQAIIFVMYAAAFRFGAHLIEIGDMTPTDVYRVFFSLAFSAASVGQSSAYVRDYQKAKIAAQCLFKLLEYKSKINVDSPLGVKPTLVGKIKFDSVYFKYPSRPDINVLKGISFTVEPGKTLALVGSSGCGKSTIVSLLERFYEPCSGTLMIDGFDIRLINVKYLRSNIGLVTQEPVLFNSSIKDNILYGTENSEAVTMADVIKAATAANIHSFIVSLPQGYDTPVGPGGNRLSGGQKQRIAIARALVRDPKILLLDEATSALDTESEKVVQEALDRARQGRTCIVIAHRLSTIQNADWIAVIHHGVIVEQGTHEELKSKQERYFQLIERQNL